MFSVGTTASLVSIKYKETKGSNLNRYEPQPGARSFRISEDNDDDESHSNNSSASHAPPETTKSTPFVTPTPSTSTSPTSTFSFLSRNSSNHRRKSKTNITKTNSSFVARIVTNSQLAKILVARTSEDTNLFYNCGSNFVWMDAFGNPKVKQSKKDGNRNLEALMALRRPGTTVARRFCKSLSYFARRQFVDSGV